MTARLLLGLWIAFAGALGGADDFARYARESKRFKAQSDGGALDDKPVLRVLRDNGVLGVAPDGSFAVGFRPFKVRRYNGLWRWPLRAGIVSSEFGRRWGRRHKGIDIAAEEGVPVLACAPGRVIFAGPSKGGYGNVIILRHDETTTSLYAHNSAIEVKAGDLVEAGQEIAKLGSTGRSTGPHVHLEIRVRSKALNPRLRLVKSRF